MYIHADLCDWGGGGGGVRGEGEKIDVLGGQYSRLHVYI